MPKLTRHIFICTNTRPLDNPKGSCAAKGSEAIRDQFAGALAKRGLQFMVCGTASRGAFI